jgi:3-oxoacid CoA-transferase B subunit
MAGIDGSLDDGNCDMVQASRGGGISWPAHGGKRLPQLRGIGVPARPADGSACRRGCGQPPRVRPTRIGAAAGRTPRYPQTMPLTRDQITIRAARELRDGYIVNLGIGMPTLVANHVPADIDVWLQSENGLLGIGPFPTEAEVDADLINAGKQTITARKGASYFSSADSFAMIRGGHIDLCILGAMQVSQDGDIANWMIPGKMVKGMGGAMDLVAGVKRVVVTMEHNAKDGGFKFVKKCSLPLTGQRCVHMLITDLAVFEFDEARQRFVLIEVAPGETVESVRGKTEAEFLVSPTVKPVAV